MEVLSRIAIWMPHITMLRGTGVQAIPEERMFRIVINYSIKKTGMSGSFVREMAQ